MQAIIMLMLFAGMFLVVQSVYEGRIRQIEDQHRRNDLVPKDLLHEPAGSREQQQPPPVEPATDVFKSQPLSV